MAIMPFEMDDEEDDYQPLDLISGYWHGIR
jgi:hypothetical protein